MGTSGHFKQQMYSTLFTLVILGAVLWLWRDSLRAREAAARVSRRACDSEGVQFLDDTVSLAGMRPVVAQGRPQLRRVYEFEFSRQGDDRQVGSVTLTGERVDTMYLGPPAGQTDVAKRPAASLVDLDSRRRH